MLNYVIRGTKQEIYSRVQNSVEDNLQLTIKSWKWTIIEKNNLRNWSSLGAIMLSDDDDDDDDNTSV